MTRGEVYQEESQAWHGPSARDNRPPVLFTSALGLCAGQAIRRPGCCKARFRSHVDRDFGASLADFATGTYRAFRLQTFLFRHYFRSFIAPVFLHHYATISCVLLDLQPPTHGEPCKTRGATPISSGKWWRKQVDSGGPCPMKSHNGRVGS